MVNSKELTIGAWVRSSKDIAQVTALYKEEDGIHVEGNLFCADDPSPEDVVTLIPDGLDPVPPDFGDASPCSRVRMLV